MSRLFCSGDCHGNIDISKFNTREFPVQDELIRDDIVWILGDFGVCWDGGRQDKVIQDWWERKNFTVISTIGNHDNTDIILNLPVVEKYGGRLYKVRDNIYYADNGIFNINGLRILNINGADSIDKDRRKEGFNWWPEEEITPQRVSNILRMIDESGEDKFDYVFSHTGGSFITNYLHFRPMPSDIQLDRILMNIRFERHYTGHYHIDTYIDRYTRIFHNDIVEIDS